MTDARVLLWGRDIAAVSWLGERNHAVFQYTPEFAGSAIEISPLTMPLREEPYAFPALSRETFKGLPGLLADALPDKFGNRLIDAWLAGQGRTAAGFNPVERLCYVGSRGMGALEFRPKIAPSRDRSRRVEVENLVRLANRVLDERRELAGRLSGVDDHEALEDILRVGTSAGGARAKAILAWNPKTGEFRSGQVDVEAGFQHWLLKFDGVADNRDKEVADPQGYGLVEYAYHLMARRAGIEMTECRLHKEGGRSHFMTRRFDRTDEGRKLHMQSLCALQHYDFNDPTAYSYEQAIVTIRQLGLGMAAIDQQFRRAVFNVVARNQDDHVKNVAFLMDRSGAWALAPAFDVIYAWQPQGDWTGRHQMSVNGKRDGFAREDFVALAETAGIKPRRAREAIDEIVAAVRKWPEFAADAGLLSGRGGEETARRIAAAHRLDL